MAPCFQQPTAYRRRVARSCHLFGSPWLLFIFPTCIKYSSIFFLMLFCSSPMIRICFKDSQCGLGVLAWHGILVLYIYLEAFYWFFIAIVWENLFFCFSRTYTISCSLFS